MRFINSSKIIENSFTSLYFNLKQRRGGGVLECEKRKGESMAKYDGYVHNK